MPIIFGIEKSRTATNADKEKFITDKVFETIFDYFGSNRQFKHSIFSLRSIRSDYFIIIFHKGTKKKRMLTQRYGIPEYD